MSASAEPLFVLRASPLRRVFGSGILAALGLLLAWLALSSNPGPAWRAGLLVAGAGALWLGRGLWVATAGHVALTDEGLCDQTGRILAPLDQIDGVDRGMFAFKPSNGLVVRLRDRAPAGWAPGLWWRFGRRLGIGGVTAGADGRALADLLSARLAGRL